MKLFALLLLSLISVPFFGMLRKSPLVFALHRPRSGRPVAPRREITIHNTAYGLIEMLRLRACTEKDPKELPLAKKPKLSADFEQQEKHVRVKRKPNTLKEKRMVHLYDLREYNKNNN